MAQSVVSSLSHALQGRVAAGDGDHRKPHALQNAGVQTVQLPLSADAEQPRAASGPAVPRGSRTGRASGCLARGSQRRLHSTAGTPQRTLCCSFDHAGQKERIQRDRPRVRMGRADAVAGKPSCFSPSLFFTLSIFHPLFPSPFPSPF